MRRRGVAAWLVLILLLTGCWSRVEVNDLAIVSMVAIDRASDGDIRLWLHVIVPARAGGAPGAGGMSAMPGNPYVTLSARGRTILEATHAIQSELPRRIFWAHARVILIGERLAREGTRPVADFLTRHRELRLTNYILVARGDLEAMLASEVDLEKLPAEYIREIQRSRIAPVTTLRDWVEALASKGLDPMLGALELVQPPPGAPAGQKPALRVRTGALFRDDKLVEFAENRLARGILWLRGDLRLGVVTVTVPGSPGQTSVEWLTAGVNRTVRWENGRLVFYVDIATEGDVSETQAKLDLSDPQTLRRVEAALNQEIKRRVTMALTTMKEQKIDPAGMGELVHQHLPGVWKRVEATWRTETLPKCQFVVTVDARVRRTGLSSKPNGVRENELIKGGR
jgi:spore germination protein KC